ncbi:MAG: rhomboid family intramembrane serine protease [Methylacidiphilales bacterium]|nr:rhomboid family intramembrane serine protease [Candidatus Methylacidiphilales bacterium]
MKHLGIATRWIVILNGLVAAVSLYFQFKNGPDGFNPVQQQMGLRMDQFWNGAWWQIFTNTWVHAEFRGMGVLHIVFNMMTLAGFGTVLERELGVRRYLVLYLLSGLAGNLFVMAEATIRWLAFGQPQLLHVSVIGASASVFGVVAAFSLIYPDVKLYLMLIPIPIRAVTAVRGLVVASVIFMLTSTMDFIAHSAHIGGALVGGLLMWVWLRRGGFSPARHEFEIETGVPPDLDEALAVSLMSRTEILSELERILSKAAREGADSLTSRERKILRRGQAMLK